jgi:hypothetical protein
VTPDNRRVFRIVAGFWLAGWFINAPGDPGFLLNFRDALAVPLSHEGFPRAATDARVAFAIYLAPLAALPAWLLVDRFARAASALFVVASLGALLHLETCSDATFATSFWVSLWLLWFSHQGARDDAAFLAIARGAAHAVLGLLFLGGFLGKCTPQYWSGDAFYGLYFQSGTGFPYPWLRGHLSAESVRSLATWFSRTALVGEGVLMLAPLLPTRFVLGLFTLTMATMMVARNYNLFSVLGCLLGLMIGAELLRRRERDAALTSPRAR